MSKDNTIYWGEDGLNELLSYNSLFNFLLGERGTGKSFALKQRGIDKYLKYGKQFAYVRRYATELEGKDIKEFFKDIREYYPEHTFEYKDGRFYIDDEIAGFTFALTSAGKKKSMSYPNIDLIIFDEFIIDTENIGNRYLKHEVETFLSLYETICRMRDVRVFFLANTVSFVNPYFTYFELELPQNKKMIKKEGDICIEIIENLKYRKAKSETRFHNLIKHTEYAKYAYQNKALRDNNNFIMKKSPDKKLMHFNLKMHGVYYGVWLAQEEGYYWVSYKHDPSYPLTYTGITDDHEVNTILLKGSSKSGRIRDFVKSYRNGLVMFEDHQIKNEVLEIIKKA